MEESQRKGEGEIMATKTEELVPLATVGDELPGKPKLRAVMHWKSEGFRGIRLGEGGGIVRCGKRVFITRTAIRRFIERCSVQSGCVGNKQR